MKIDPWKSKCLDKEYLCVTQNMGVDMANVKVYPASQYISKFVSKKCDTNTMNSVHMLKI